MARHVVILVDSSVWIHYFRGRPIAPVEELTRCLEEGNDLCTCGLIFTEVLQGVREDDAFRIVRARLEQLTWLPMDQHVFFIATDLARALRRKGLGLKNTIDPLIAATAISAHATLLHADQDFEVIATHSPLITWKGPPSA